MLAGGEVKIPLLFHLLYQEFSIKCQVVGIREIH